MATFFDLLRYFHTGVSSSDMTEYDKALAKSIGGGGSPTPTPGDTVDMTNLTWDNYNGNDYYGTFPDYNRSRLSHSEYVPIPDGATELRIEALQTNDMEFDFFVYYYRPDDNKTYITYEDWIASSERVLDIQQEAGYFRIGMRNKNNDYIAVSDILSVTAHFS